MSGHTLAYHLRLNKAIERQLFIELMTLLAPAFQLHRYTYAGMGGPFLEDFRLVHALLGIRKMISFDSRDSVFGRQLLNRPSSCVSCVKKHSSQFIDDFVRPPNGVLFWLDFTTADLRAQLDDVARLAQRLGDGDILRVTLNAAPSSLAPGAGPEVERMRLEKLKQQIEDFLPNGTSTEDISLKKYPGLLVRVLGDRIQRALEERGDLSWYPISAFSYADGQQMVTTTGMVVDAKNGGRRLKASLEAWKYVPTERRRVVAINVPDLSAREKMLLDSKLPRYRRTLPRYLPFVDAASVLSYAEFYRYVPHFLRVNL